MAVSKELQKIMDELTKFGIPCKTVEDFQRLMGCTVDGIVGPETTDAINLMTEHRAKDEFVKCGKYVSKHFKETDFVCKNGKNLTRINPRQVKLLDKLADKVGGRDKFVDYNGKSGKFISAYRTPAYNMSVGGEDFSRHMIGFATDVKIAGYNPVQVYELAKELGFGGRGLYKSFTHIDCDRARTWRG